MQIVSPTTTTPKISSNIQDIATTPLIASKKSSGILLPRGNEKPLRNPDTSIHTLQSVNKPEDSLNKEQPRDLNDVIKDLEKTRRKLDGTSNKKYSIFGISRFKPKADKFIDALKSYEHSNSPESKQSHIKEMEASVTYLIKHIPVSVKISGSSQKTAFLNEAIRILDDLKTSRNSSNIVSNRDEPDLNEMKSNAGVVNNKDSRLENEKQELKFNADVVMGYVKSHGKGITYNDIIWRLVKDSIGDIKSSYDKLSKGNTEVDDFVKKMISSTTKKSDFEVLIKSGELVKGLEKISNSYLHSQQRNENVKDSKGPVKSEDHVVISNNIVSDVKQKNEDVKTFIDLIIDYLGSYGKGITTNTQQWDVIQGAVGDLGDSYDGNDKFLNSFIEEASEKSYFLKRLGEDESPTLLEQLKKALKNFE